MGFLFQDLLSVWVYIPKRVEESVDARSIEYTKGVKSGYTPLDLGVGTKPGALPAEPCL